MHDLHEQDEDELPEHIQDRLDDAEQTAWIHPDLVGLFATCDPSIASHFISGVWQLERYPEWESRDKVLRFILLIWNPETDALPN